MRITVITPTGDRPEAFSLCRKYMARQDLQPYQWIVVDDGVIPLPLSLCEGCEYIRRTGGENHHTLCNNILAALPHVKGDAIVFMEDDDWYHHKYLKVMEKYLCSYNLVGQCKTLYYHIGQRKYYRCPNTLHASLCQTGLRLPVFPSLEQLATRLVGKKPFLDMFLWKEYTDSQRVFEHPIDLCIGIKGSKGRQGTTKGWDSMNSNYIPDPNLSMFKKLIGKDYHNYV